MAKPIHTEIEHRPECVVVRIAGDFRLWEHLHSADKFLEELKNTLGALSSPLVLNLSGMTHVDSRAIGMLVSVPVECRRRKMPVSVVLPSGVPRMAIEVSHIFDACHYFDDETAAIASNPAPQH